MLMHIKSAKGKKDSVVRLFEKILKLLRIYYKAYKQKRLIPEGMDGDKYSNEVHKPY